MPQSVFTDDRPARQDVISDPGEADHISIRIRKCPRWKRVLDVVGASLLLVCLGPVLGLIALYIKLVSRGPALFVQERLGLGGEYFRIYKFRTMLVTEVSRDSAHREFVNSHSQSNSKLEKPDVRSQLIPGGRLLRQLSIDEFPQLLNVLQGNMSLVGPRPDLMHLCDYETCQLRRFEVLPGMTGLWQVSGKNETTFEEMMSLDVAYIDQLSFGMDLKILAKTVFVLIYNRNE